MYNDVFQSYRDTVEKTSTIKELDAAQLVQETARALGDILHKKIIALQVVISFIFIHNELMLHCVSILFFYPSM